MPSTSRDTSSSAPDMLSKPRRELLELGDALVVQLNLEQSNDILGRWMAHHLARLLQEAKIATGEEKDALEQRCFDAVLAVWKHRNCLPQGLRPFEPAERLLDIVAALDPDASQPFYGRAMLQWDDLDELERPTEAEAKRFNVARQFDHAARIIVRHLLGCAVEDLPEDTREWVRRAQGAGAEGPDVITIRRLLLSSDSTVLGQGLEDGHIRKLRSRLEELDRFVDIAKGVRDDLGRRVAQAEAQRSAGDDES